MRPKDTLETNPQLTQKRRALFRAFLRLRNVDDCEQFLTDLCTPAEMAAMADRWAVVQLLGRDIPYRQIQVNTKVSTATITRVARAFFHGEGGYRAILKRQKGANR